MKGKLLVGLLSFMSLNANAQYTTGNTAFIGEGTTVTFDGLVLIPSNGNLVLSNKTLSKSTNALKGSSSNSISKCYTFNESFNFSGEVGIVYLPSELNGNSESELQIAYASQNGGFVTTSNSFRDEIQHLVKRSFDNQNLVKITAVNASSVLPVTLIAFKVQWVENKVSLNWNTASEINSDHFEIQHSTNGKVWNILGNVKAAGESKNSANYEYKHSNPDAGENLYRLKMVDSDGTFAFSKIVSIQLAGSNVLNVYPNPVTDRLTIQSNRWKDVQSLEVYNLVGKLIRKLNAPESSGSQLKSIFDFQGLPTGVYTLKSTLNNGKVATYRILKK